MPHDRQCFANHLAAQWAIEPQWAQRLLAQVKATGLPTMQADRRDREEIRAAADPFGGAMSRSGSVAVISIDGPMSKFDSSMGGANTVRLRAAVRAAAGDESVSAIILRVDSPGGTVDGTKELADEVAAADLVKPVYGYAEDMAASAALWVIAQARKVFANATALVGSIGVYTVLVDSSKAYELAGLQAEVIGSGGLKGMGADGVPISDEYKAYVQGIIADRTQFFIQAIMDGRNMAKADVKAIADGRVFSSSEAKRLGLIDGIKTFDEVVALAQPAKPRQRDRMAAMLEIESQT